MNAPLIPATSAKAVAYSGGVTLMLMAVLLPSAPVCGAAAAYTDVKVVSTPAASSSQPLYTGNREPLLPSPLVKLPIGSIIPKGWVRHQLELEAQGMTGRLSEVSPWLKFEGSAWSDPQGQGKNGWEELPYWLKGYGDLGYVLNDPEIIKAARKWIDAVLASQQADGWFGPIANKTGLEGKPDLWPHMVMCNVLQSFYEFTGDERVLPFLTRYFKWLSTQPDKNFGAGYWPRIRFGDNIETLYWLYNRTDEAWMLELAKRIHDNMEPWTTGVHNWHNVNLAQGFREPGVFYLQGREESFLRAAENNYQTIMGPYGQFPGGGFAGDENCRPGYTDPRQGFETCGIVEFMHSFEMLTKISGNPLWADRCEDIAVNSLPASLTPDWKGLHYLTGANQVQLDKGNKSPAIQNGGTMFSYSAFERYRCCQHNVSHGWPYYAEELWLATADRGLCASLYAASEVTAKVGTGANVKVVEEADYPFGDTVTLKFSAAQPVKFPLYLRIPRWCEAASMKINGKAVRVAAKPLSYVVLEREWKDGDTVSLRLPMEVRVQKWEKNQSAVSVSYGVLTFSLKIGERWQRCGGTDAWPEMEVFPTTPWNYGLAISEKNPAKSFKVVKWGGGPLPAQPFTPATAPIELRVPAKQIPEWKPDSLGLVGKLQASPVKSDQPIETVTLIPMGGARLRVTSFPVIGQGPDAHTWAAAKPLPVSASHCFENDTVAVLVKPQQPKSSNDQSIPRFTWWDHRGTAEWVEYNFDKPRKVSAVEVYWFDDTGVGGCRVPQSWKVLRKQGGNWKAVEGASGFETKLDANNRASFTPTETLGLRIEAQLQPEFSGGILSLKIIE
jgi:hypothetical protein